MCINSSWVSLSVAKTINDDDDDKTDHPFCRGCPAPRGEQRQTTVAFPRRPHSVDRDWTKTWRVGWTGAGWSKTADSSPQPQDAAWIQICQTPANTRHNTHRLQQRLTAAYPWQPGWAGIIKIHSFTYLCGYYAISLINFLHLLRSISSSFFSYRDIQSFSTTSLQVFFGFPLDLTLSTS